MSEAELPHSRSRDQHSAGGHPGEGRWAVTASEGKDSDSSDSRKTFIILFFFTCSVDSFKFFSFFFFSFSLPLV